MALTRVSPALFATSNNITSVTVGGSANTISLTFDSNGVITGASNNAVSVANTAITGNIISSQITSVANTQISGNITAAQITSVANTQLTGLIQAAQIGSANATLITSGTLPGARLPAGSVLQVVSASITGENATTSTTFTSAFLSASITPTSATSKVLAIVNGASFGVSGNAEGFFTIDRSGTNLGNGTSGLGRVWNAASSNYTFVPGILMVLDSPATTSSITYTVQQRQTNAAQNVYIGGGAGKSSIVLMEIAA